MPPPKKPKSSRNINRYIAGLFAKIKKNIALISLVISLLTLLILVFDPIQTAQEHTLAENQANLAERVATFEASVHATSESQAEKQLSVEQTQVAISQYQKEILRRQSFPFPRSVNSHAEVAVLQASQVKSSDIEDVWEIDAIGEVNSILVNDGGARAGLVGVRWINPENVEWIHGLKVVAVGDSDAQFVSLPLNVEGQSTVGLHISLQGKIKVRDDVSRQNSYQLGKTWVENLRRTKTQLEFEFSNADKIILPVHDFILKIPIVTILPTPRSPFVATNADVLGEICFKFLSVQRLNDSAGNLEAAEITGTIKASFLGLSNQHTSDIQSLKSGDCLTLPVDHYEMRWSFPEFSARETTTEFFVSNGPNRVIEARLDDRPNAITFYIRALANVETLLVVTSIAFLVPILFFLFNFVAIRTFMPPPDGFIRVLRLVEFDNRREIVAEYSIRTLGVDVNRSKVTIGSKGHIRISSLRPIEFRVERIGTQSVLIYLEPNMRITLSDFIRTVQTSDRNIVLEVGLKMSRVEPS